MLVSSTDGNVIYVNHDCSTMFGYSIDEATLLKVEDFVPPKQRSRHLEYRKAYCAAPTRRVMGGDRIVAGIRKDGGEFPVEVGLGTLATSEGVRIVATILDISRQREDEAKLLAANAELARKNGDLDEFVYMASHDLQEPIRKLISFSELLPGDLGGELPERAAMDLGFITESAYRMRQLIQDLLVLSRAGKASLQIREVDLGQCVASVLDVLADKIESLGATIHVPELPRVTADAFLMTQLFQNLITNSLKFVAEGVRPVVFVTVEDGGDGPIFGVRDNGIGIAPEFHDRVFGAFRRLHTRSEYEGTGIGLSICRKAVERHGGRIWVESEAGAGAHFRFSLGEAPKE